MLFLVACSVSLCSKECTAYFYCAISIIVYTIRTDFYIYDGKLIENMLNDCYNYSAAINTKGQPFRVKPLIMALLLSQDKVINRLTELISKCQSPDNNKVIKKSEEESGRENAHDYIRKNDGRIHYIDDY